MPTEAPTAHQFNDAAQQREAATLGMWVFLATEVLFFGGLFLAYTVYRISDPHAFLAASNHTLVAVGTINTAILLLSSFTMVLAVRAAEVSQARVTAAFLGITALLGAVFLTIKGVEYHHEIQEGLFPGAAFHLEGTESPIARMFFYLYFVMTGIHGLHVLIGIGLLLGFAFRMWRTHEPAALHTSIDLLGLYWHFVDLVWVFLFPLLYLAGRSS